MEGIGANKAGDRQHPSYIQRHNFLSAKAKKMITQFLLFVIAIILVAIFWELTKINNQLKKAFPGTFNTTTERKLKEG